MLGSFELDVAGDGSGRVVINGVELSAHVVGLILSAQVGSTPQLTLYLSGAVVAVGDAETLIKRYGPAPDPADDPDAAS
jgi:hypothetical protein